MTHAASTPQTVLPDFLKALSFIAVFKPSALQMRFFINDSERRLRAGWRLLIQVLLLVICLFLLHQSVQFVWGHAYLEETSNVLAETINALGATISVWIAARYMDKRSFFDYGLALDLEWAREFVVGLVIAAIAISMIFLIGWASGWTSVSGYGWSSRSGVSFAVGITTYFLAHLMVGFYEELLSSGYQVLNLTEGLRYPGIGEREAVAIAVLVASSIFGFLHFDNPNASVGSALSVILAGVVLTLPYVLTGSLALSIGLHFGWNFVQGGVFGLPLSGFHYEESILQLERGGPELWTGGAFGPTAGLLGLLGMTVMAGLICAYVEITEHELTIAPLFTGEFQRSDISNKEVAS